jgi:uncharacterized membrane protein SirB2
MYLGLKHSHLLFIIISILLFELRFFLLVFNKPIHRALKIIPHINDSLLLITGVSLAVIAGIKPWEQSWLAYKLIALVFYIVFGAMALKTSGSKRMIAFVLATVAILFMIFTAINKNPLFFLSY